MLKDYIYVDDDFQTSVNIAYDLKDENKIKKFIPTNEGIKIIEEVILSTVPTSTQRARVFVGAYGKGKSHIVLVILAMLSLRNTDIFDDMLDKIKKINEPLCTYLQNYLAENAKLLPIVVSGSSTNLAQSFMYSLQKTLEDNNLDNLMPKTNFSAVIEKIDDWYANYPDTYKKFEKSIDCDVDGFKAKLRQYDPSAYKKFTDIFPQLTAGTEFNPFLAFDPVEVYESVNEKLCRAGYGGMYIVYDEFGKYLEANISRSGESDTKLLQNFAEKCNRSGNKQMHLMLICHKDISNYIDENIPKDRVDGWRGVSGRYKTMEMDGDYSRTYGLISDVIKKKDTFYSDFLPKYSRIFENRFNDFRAKPYFSDCDNNTLKNIIIECYPLSPLTVYILPRISEKIAQNERTLFTFLAAKEKFSLWDFVENSTENFPSLGADAVYDYFEPLLRREPYTSKAYEIYRLADSALYKTEAGSLESKIIKAIAVVYIIDRFDRFPAKIETIYDIVGDSASSLGEINNAVENLIKNDCVVYRQRSTGYLQIKSAVDFNIPREIEKKIADIKCVYAPAEILNSEQSDLCIYPNAYNNEHEIRRYFRVKFISSQSLLSNPDILFKDNADGALYAVIPDKYDDIVITKKIISDDELSIGEADKNKIIWAVPNDFNRNTHLIYEYKAVNILRNECTDEFLLREYDMYLSDLSAVIENYINEYLKPELFAVSYYYLGEKKKIGRKSQLSLLISDICRHMYPNAPIISNESVNKNILPKMANNSRNKILNSLIKEVIPADLGFAGNGQEVFFARSLLFDKKIIINNNDGTASVNTNIKDEKMHNLLNVIDEFFASATDEPKTFSILYNQLTLPITETGGKGIGLKRGVIPVYIATMFRKYSSSYTILYENKEARISGELFALIDLYPDKYFIKYSEWNESRDNYIRELEQIFKNHIVVQEKLFNDYSYLTKAMNRWYLTLPGYAKNGKELYSCHDKFKPIPLRYAKFIHMVKQLDINPKEFLFEELPEIFGYETFEPSIINDISDAKYYYDRRITVLEDAIKEDTKEIFGGKGKEISSVSAAKDWVENLPKEVQTHSFDNGENKILNIISEADYDEHRFILRLARILSGLRIEDWNEKTVNIYKTNLTAVVNTVQSYKENDEMHGGVNSYKIIFTDENGKEKTKSFEKVEYSKRAKLLYNDIESAIDEIGRSVSPREKRRVLMSILEKLL